MNMNVQKVQDDIDDLDRLIHKLRVEEDTLSLRISDLSAQRRRLLNSAPAILMDAARSEGATHTPHSIVSFPGRSRAQGSNYVSPADESVEWPDDAA